MTDYNCNKGTTINNKNKSQYPGNVNVRQYYYSLHFGLRLNMHKNPYFLFFSWYDVTHIVISV